MTVPVAVQTPHPAGLALQDACRLLVAEAQLQPHGVRVHQPVQDAEPPMERVVARVSGSGRRRHDPGTRRGLQEETAHLLAEPRVDNRKASSS